MTFLDLRKLTAAEEYFEALEVPFDPLVLAPIRLAVLKRFGVELQAIAGVFGHTDAQRLAAARAALENAYETLRRPKPARLYAGPLVTIGRPQSGA